jgi:hypothetical protein
LGLAYFRLDDWSASGQAWTKALELDGKEEPLDLFFLAATEQRRGNKDLARIHYCAAVRSLEHQPPADPERQSEMIRVREEVSRIVSE